MRRASIFGVCVMCAGLVAACGSNRTAQANNDTGTNAPAARAFRSEAGSRPQPVDVRGCLTASGDQFVLTQLQDASAATQPTTQAFLITNAAVQDVDLKQYLGKEVHVAGEADPPRVAEVREGDATTPAGTTGQNATAPPARPNDAAGQAGVHAKVGTEEDTRFAARKLTVSSITPTGNPCPAAPGTASSPQR